MINTYAESKLHKELKNAYAQKYMGKTEQAVMGKICDILTNDGAIIEIQTQNLGKLLKKIAIFTPNHTMKIVYPLATEKIIETYSQENELLSKRKSPKKQNIYSIFRELTAIYPFLLENNLTLEILETSITEIRIKTQVPIQLKNNSRHFKKEWYKKDKKLNNIYSSITLKNEEDYINLLPKNLPKEFSAKDLKNLGVGNNAHCMLWVYKKMGLIEFTQKKDRCNYYRIAIK